MFFFFTLLVMVVLSCFTKTPRSILIRLAVFIIVWGNFTGLCFMNKYSIEEKCKTVSELNNKDERQLAEEIIKHNESLILFGVLLWKENHYETTLPIIRAEPEEYTTAYRFYRIGCDEHTDLRIHTSNIRYCQWCRDKKALPKNTFISS